MPLAPIRAQPVYTPATGLLENLGPVAQPVLSEALKRMGFDRLQSFYEQGQTLFALPFGTNLGVKFTEKVYPAGDRQITKDEVRKKCDELYRCSGQNIIWVETQGQVDLNKNTKNQIPLGTYASGQSSFG